MSFALQHGYTHIDAALQYGQTLQCATNWPGVHLKLTIPWLGNEDKVGEGIVASGVDRSDFWVTSKLWNNDHRDQEAYDGIKKTISDLQVGYLDLYLMHWPVAFMPGEGTVIDTHTSIVDTWRTMEGLVRANLTRYIGISNFSPEDVATILDVCDICPYAHEYESHPYLQQQGFLDYHANKGIKVISYSPLGNLNPRYDSGVPSLLKDPFWAKLAEAKNATIAQTSLAWGMQRGSIVIPKSVHESYISENLGSLKLKFTDEEMVTVASQDKRLRMNDPGDGWGVGLFQGLDDPTELGDDLDDEDGEL